MIRIAVDLLMLADSNLGLPNKQDSNLGCLLAPFLRRRMWPRRSQEGPGSYINFDPGGPNHALGVIRGARIIFLGVIRGARITFLALLGHVLALLTPATYEFPRWMLPK